MHQIVFGGRAPPEKWKEGEEMKEEQRGGREGKGDQGRGNCAGHRGFQKSAPVLDANDLRCNIEAFEMQC